jgi:hypothetical protein
VTLFAGMNDVVSRRFDAAQVEHDVAHMQRALIENGATVVGFTLPDLSIVLPIARPVAHRVRSLNDALARASESSGAILVDVARHPVASDPRLWSVDRLHANASGHERIAAALAWGLGLPGADESWSQPLPTAWSRTLPARIRGELHWQRTYFLPWLWRHLRGRSSGDDRGPKLPSLTTVEV